MSGLSNMPAAGVIVVALIVILFILAVVLLFYVYARYLHLSSKANASDGKTSNFMRYVMGEFSEAYRAQGQDTNTPAIVSNAVNSKLSGLLLCERFLGNAVSLFVTLGLFGTFLGLSLSVSSLTELIGYSNTSEWLSVLDSVGGGLMSALSGMGVAFYTSLVGVACSIVLTVLRSIFSPQQQREKLEMRLELWLDHTVAPTLKTDKPKDDASLVRQMIDALNTAADSMNATLSQSTAELNKAIESSKLPIAAFNKTVSGFNDGVRDFSEFNYNLRGTVERMDVTVRDLVSGLREVARKLERGETQ